MRASDSSSADDSAAFLEAVARGIASAELGRVADYEAVRRWMLSWGTEGELEPPPCE